MTELTGLGLVEQVFEPTFDAWYMDYPQPGPWAAEGACVGADPDLFFPPKGGYGPRAQRAAIRICQECSVRTDCLEYAINAGRKLHGVWGGESERGRERIRIQRRGLAS